MHILVKQMLDEWPIVKIMYRTEKVNKKFWHHESFEISPRENYMVNFEILASGGEGILKLQLDRKLIGKCQPDGITGTGCNFLDCTDTLSPRYVASDSGSLSVLMKYAPQPELCDCTNEKAKCGLDNEISNLKQISTAVRITLTPIGT